MRYLKKINSEEKVFVRSSCDIPRGRSNTVPINSNCLDSGELNFLVDRKNIKTLKIPDFVNEKIIAMSLQPTPTSSRTKLIGVGHIQVSNLVAKLTSVSNVDLAKTIGSKCYLPKLSKKLPNATRLQLRRFNSCPDTEGAKPVDTMNSANTGDLVVSKDDCSEICFDK